MLGPHDGTTFVPDIKEAVHAAVTPVVAASQIRHSALLKLTVDVINKKNFRVI